MDHGRQATTKLVIAEKCTKTNRQLFSNLHRIKAFNKSNRRTTHHPKDLLLLYLITGITFFQ